MDQNLGEVSNENPEETTVKIQHTRRVHRSNSTFPSSTPGSKPNSQLSFKRFVSSYVHTLLHSLPVLLTNSRKIRVPSRNHSSPFALRYTSYRRSSNHNNPTNLILLDRIQKLMTIMIKMMMITIMTIMIILIDYLDHDHHQLLDPIQEDDDPLDPVDNPGLGGPGSYRWSDSQNLKRDIQYTILSVVCP